MPRKEQGWITFQASEEERKLLEEVCEKSQRSKTEILRELLRTLGHHSSTTSLANKYYTSEDVDTTHIEFSETKKTLKVSSRNVLKGVVKRMIMGPVNSEVTLEIVHQVELTSVITRVSAEELELSVGKEAYALIKSNDVVIARD